jgi:hypothetical protein
MSEANHDENEFEEVKNWWDEDKIMEADDNAALDLEQFTSEFVGLLVKAVHEDPNLRENVDKLCDYKPYKKCINLNHHSGLLRAVRFYPPKSLKVDFIRLERKVKRSYLNQSEWEYYTGGSIARELRKALGYDEYNPWEMCDELTREMFVEYELPYC